MSQPLQDMFDDWVRQAPDGCRQKPWMLSKWEVVEGVEWSEEKIERLLSSIREGLDLQEDDMLADLGCGGGWILERLRQGVKYGVGVDFSLPMLQQASSALTALPLMAGEIGRLPFKSETFDKLLSYFVFINFMDDTFVYRAIADIYRVLKPGGRALLGQLPDKEASSVYDREKQSYFLYLEETFNLGRSLRDICPIPQKLYNRSELESFLKRSGMAYDIRPSFNPFYRPGVSDRIEWRFDIILRKSL